MGNDMKTTADEHEILDPDQSAVSAKTEPKLQLFQFSDPAEIAALMPVIHAGHLETRYGHLPFSETKMLRRLQAILQYIADDRWPKWRMCSIS